MVKIFCVNYNVLTHIVIVNHTEKDSCSDNPSSLSTTPFLRVHVERFVRGQYLFSDTGCERHVSLMVRGQWMWEAVTTFVETLVLFRMVCARRQVRWDALGTGPISTDIGSDTLDSACTTRPSTDSDMRGLVADDTPFCLVLNLRYPFPQTKFLLV